jgi:hypothetical protein
MQNRNTNVEGSTSALPFGKPMLGAVLHERLISTLARKEKEYGEVCHWFETEYDSSVSAETVADWEKTSIEINAQIKILRFLLSDDAD